MAKGRRGQAIRCKGCCSIGRGLERDLRLMVVARISHERADAEDHKVWKLNAESRLPNIS